MWIPAGATAQTNFTVKAPPTNHWNEQRSTPISFTATNTTITPNLNARAINSYTLLLPSPQVLNFKLKLAGVTDGKAEGSKINVKFYLQDGNVKTLPDPLTLTHLSQGVYTTSATITNPLAPGVAFSVLIKGEKHGAIRYCKFAGQTTRCEFNQTMAYGPTPSDVIFDFTELPLPPGDLSPQDGKVDSSDISILKALMGKTQGSLTPTDLAVGDLNYDGYINMFDTFLMLKTMEVRYDE
jgi:hypothetical protein